MKDNGHPINGALAVLMIVLYMAFFAIGLGAVPW
jgi:hypothetical protein